MQFFQLKALRTETYGASEDKKNVRGVGSESKKSWLKEIDVQWWPFFFPFCEASS